MGFTGEFYNFYSDKDIEIVLGELEKFSKSIGYKCDYLKDEQHNRIEAAFFYKNERMKKLHLRKGYNTSLGDEGCFTIEVMDTTLDAKTYMFEFNKKPIDKIETCFILSKIYNYFLVLPDLIEKNTFSNRVYWALYAILKER